MFYFVMIIYLKFGGYLIEKSNRLNSATCGSLTEPA